MAVIAGRRNGTLKLEPSPVCNLYLRRWMEMEMAISRKLVSCLDLGRLLLATLLTE